MHVILLFIALIPLLYGGKVTTPNTQPDGYVIAMDLPLRLHRLPSTQTDTMAVLAPGTAVTMIQRTQDGEWLDVRAPEGQEGWMMTEFAEVLIDVSRLPVMRDFDDLPRDPITFTPAVTRRVRLIFQAGQEIGNNAGVLAKVGDSITAAPHFLTPIGEGFYNLGDYQYLQGVINTFSAVEVRDGKSSFDAVSLAAGVGWPAHAAIDPRFADPALCEAGESPLTCEYRLIRPSIALIMFGTNDVSRFDADVYKGNLQQIVQTSIEMGVIPVISTIPNRIGFEDKVDEFNRVISETAGRFSIPLWDYYAAMVTLPDGGLNVDGTHPSIPPFGERGSADFRANNLYYGYVVRNLTALQVLDALWGMTANPTSS
jgi:GDSL-like lipase/acylhydrolase family protein